MEAHYAIDNTTYISFIIFGLLSALVGDESSLSASSPTSLQMMAGNGVGLCGRLNSSLTESANGEVDDCRLDSLNSFKQEKTTCNILVAEAR